MMSETPLYEHKQSPLWLKVLLIGVFVFPLTMTITTKVYAGAIGFLLTPILLLALFGSFTTSVSAKSIKLSFGVGLIHRTIPRDSIASVAAVRNPWWYGFGIRLTPHGWLWNISGLDAVEIRYKDGKKFRIGTDEPEKLLQVLQ